MLQLVIVLVPPSKRDVAHAVRTLMTPHTAHEVEPRKEYWSAEDFALLRQSYPEDQFDRWLDDRRALGIDVGIDENGYYEWSSVAADAWFESWVFGGGWDGALAGCGSPSGANKWPTQLDGNACRAADFPPDLIPHAIVTPDGKLHTRTRPPWSEEERDPAWEAQARALLQAYPDHVAVVVEGTTE